MGNYTPVGDILVSTICIAMIILILCSYNRHTRSFRVFLAIIGLLILAANTNITFNMLASLDMPHYHNLIYGLRCFYHACLFTIFALYVVYITEVTHLSPTMRKRYIFTGCAIQIFVIVTDVLQTVTGNYIVISSAGVTNKGLDIFLIGYVAFLMLLMFMLLHVRNRLFRNVVLGFYGTVFLSLLMLFLAGMFREKSFTVATFLYPVIGMFYIMHSNPYDVRLGTVDSNAFEDMIRDNLAKGRDFVYMSLYMRAFDEEDLEIPGQMQAIIREYAEKAFKGTMLFQVQKGHMILVFPIRRNPDYQNRIQLAYERFYQEYARFNYDYKIVTGHSNDTISRENKYVNLINYIHQHMEEDTIHKVDEQDLEDFRRTEYILTQLSDIFQKQDMDDPRVLAYCQPVLNIQTRIYDTAEALMRLKLDGLGMIFPDEFIPLAEENGYIHVLTEIILHKTCEEVRKLLEESYMVSRISVNVSALELKDDAFCMDINQIIDASGIPGDKIAIELTESQNENDFILMKDKINQLKDRGIKFYLDDFGTGYSNMERIMELPFDIIKFDRSLVLASDASERSKEIVKSLAGIFARMKYAVLYEGVEKDADEIMCMNMDASFLQGYKYSRPVPIEELEHFFKKAS